MFVLNLARKLTVVILIALLVLNILAVYGIIRFDVKSEEWGVCARLGCGWPGITVCYDWNGGRCYFPYAIVE